MRTLIVSLMLLPLVLPTAPAAEPGGNPFQEGTWLHEGEGMVAYPNAPPDCTALSTLYLLSWRSWSSANFQLSLDGCDNFATTFRGIGNTETGWTLVGWAGEPTEGWISADPDWTGYHEIFVNHTVGGEVIRIRGHTDVIIF